MAEWLSMREKYVRLLLYASDRYNDQWHAIFLLFFRVAYERHRFRFLWLRVQGMHAAQSSLERLSMMSLVPISSPYVRDGTGVGGSVKLFLARDPAKGYLPLPSFLVVPCPQLT